VAEPAVSDRQRSPGDEHRVVDSIGTAPAPAGWTISVSC
jgi:hypothetical protein